MSKRKIKRIAFLQEYENRPERLIKIIPEVARKGYCAIGLAVRIGQEKYIEELAGEAERNNLEMMAFTGYMKYEQGWLKEHPGHRMILSNEGDSEDQDRVSINWGCPFNPEFKRRYLNFLRFLGSIDNMTEIWINDEASLGRNSRSIGCYCDVCRNDWRKEFGNEMPVPPFENNEIREEFIRWRFARWNAVHWEMKKALCEHHNVRAIFLTDPGTCWWVNPWISGVDFSSMLEGIDGLMTDPYYTFHLSWGDKGFVPREVYLSECCRFVKGIAGDEKVGEICTQGFSHPTFTRPLDERDGLWAGIVPLALGIDSVTSYTYLLQKVSPMQESYERTFGVDKFFSKAKPIDFVGIVDSLETQCFHFCRDEDNWHGECMLPVSELARHSGLAYRYLPSGKIVTDEIFKLPVLILPNVSCLSEKQCDALLKYVESGGTLIGFGEIGTRDEVGKIVRRNFLSDMFGITSIDVGEYVSECEFEANGRQSAFSNLAWPDEIVGRYGGGIYYPAMGLECPVKITVKNDVDIIAKFAGNEKLLGCPAIVSSSLGQGKTIYVGGISKRLYMRREYGLRILNFAPIVISRLINDLVEEKPVLRVKGFPPIVPMKKVRPLDPRNMPTMEFLPCVGENLYLATIASYFKKPFALKIEAIVPQGKKLKEIRELVENVDVDKYELSGDRVVIEAEFGFNDSLKVFGIFFE